ncbi:hypothetical protein HYZ78_03065 [Candidatus Microgenomates bacterium]|nr:hypothetical protein [Candidatus Microgenomates bacterium]
MDNNQGKSRFQDTIARANNILIVLPQNPDTDAVAAGLSLYLALSAYGKASSVFCPSDMLVEFNRLVAVDKVSRELGEKNLTITLRDYPAANIDRVSYNIEGNQMELTIIPKSQVNAPLPDQIVGKLGGMSADTAILVGNVTRESLGEAYAELEKIPSKIVIMQGNRPQAMDPRMVRQSSPQVGTVEIVDPNASSISELVGNLLFDMNLPVSGDTANNILMGVTMATNNFTSNHVRPETFELAARLARVRGNGSVGSPQVGVAQPSAQEAPAQEPAPNDWTQAPKVYKSNLEG